MFADYAGVAEDREQVGVATPAGHDMQVQVLMYAGAGHFAEVVAHVEAVGPHDFAHGRQQRARQVGHCGVNVLAQLGETACVLVRRDHDVPAVVRVQVHEREAFVTLEQHELFFEVAAFGLFAEDAARVRGPLAEDVLYAPGRPEFNLCNLWLKIIYLIPFTIHSWYSCRMLKMIMKKIAAVVNALAMRISPSWVLFSSRNARAASPATPANSREHASDAPNSAYQPMPGAFTGGSFTDHWCSVG
ncbi:MAG: hypothetical protein UW03_C0043G0015 [Candidatus Peregrinibacteria bacterium GW2011_GWA2_43_8]|nr:MAG: hypothetical protein UW03_C0043G0015 [Candidatus Peregrinibacteria bacterium GW2011_GWA2_43_8]